MARKSKRAEGAAELDAFVSGLSDRVLHCRELGHVWKALTVSWDATARAYDRRLRCPSCRTIRVQLLDSSGHPVSNRYIYPDGYLAKGTAHNLNRDAFRLEAVTRFLAPAEGVA